VRPLDKERATVLQDLFDAPARVSRRSVLRGMLVGSAALGGAGVLAACGRREESGTTTAAADAAAQRGGTIVWGKPAEATLLDPTTGGVGSSMELFQIVYDPLIAVDGELELIPALATSWESPSPTEYRFTLREGVRFSNGRALTTEDVVRTFERYLDPRVPSSLASFLDPRTRVARVDARTVRFTLPAQSSTFLPALASAYAVILPMAEVDGGEIDLSRAMLGTGPFMVESHKAGSRWVLRRNPHAWQPPIADELVIRIMPDDNARIAALRDGSIDLTYFDVPDAERLLAEVPDTEVKVQDRTDFYVLVLNATGSGSPFTDAKVRQAISYAIDRDQIREIALAGTGLPTGVVSAAFGDVAPAPTLGHDPERARTLLAEAGQSDLSFEIVYPGEAFGRIAQVLQQNLEAVGVKVTLGSLEEGVWVDRVYTQRVPRFDATVSWYAAYAGPAQALNLWNRDISPFNFQVRDADTQSLIVRAQQAAPDAEGAALQAASEAVDRQATMIPLVTKNVTIAWRTDLIRVIVDDKDGNIHPLRHSPEYALLAAA
jgi:peptide/nickel transport system substrate-binding protein